MKQLCLLIAFALLVGCNPATDPGASSSPSPGQTGATGELPGFNLLSHTGETISFAPGGDDKLTVLAFWSPTWDPDHQVMLDRLIELHERYAVRGLRVVVVTYDEEPKTVRAIAQKRRFPFEVAIGAKSTYQRYDLQAVPTFLVVTPKGEVAERFEGHLAVDKFVKKISNILPGREGTN